MDQLEQQQVVVLPEISLEQLDHSSHHLRLTRATNREPMFVTRVKRLENSLHFQQVGMVVLSRIAKTTHTEIDVLVLHPVRHHEQRRVFAVVVFRLEQLLLATNFCHIPAQVSTSMLFRERNWLI